MLACSWSRRVRPKVRLALRLTLLTGLGGCAGWHRLDTRPGTVLAHRQQVQVWEGTHARILHAVRITQDSVSGVPFQEPPSCDSCRVALPLSRVDSLRVGNQEIPAIVGGTLPFVLLIALLIGIRGPVCS